MLGKALLGDPGLVNGSPLHSAEPDVDVPMVERVAAGQVGRQEIMRWPSERTVCTPLMSAHVGDVIKTVGATPWPTSISDAYADLRCWK